jgi:TolA-binding protein
MMELKEQAVLIPVFLCLAAGLGGCAGLRATDIRDGSSTQTNDTNDTVAKRFQEPETRNSTLIESAVDLSDRYAKLTVKMAELQQQHQDLQRENGQLKSKTQSLEMQVKQREAELDESNRLVMDLNAELQIWKKDILGFRSEMRAASTAELNALMKIMTAIGVEESAEDPAPEENAADRAESN